MKPVFCRKLSLLFGMMSHRHALEALDRTLKDIRGNQSDLGGVILLLSDDFRQTLPIISRGHMMI
jgi:hypothetical protein